jgi:hypothetical protein
MQMAHEINFPVAAPDGTGVCALSAPIEGVPEEHLWTVLLNKAYHPDLYIPMKDITTRDNPDGSIWRKMFFDASKIGKGKGKGPAPGQGEPLIEIITVDQATGIIKFVVVDEADQPTGEVHYNILHRDPYRIETSQCGPDGKKVLLNDGTPVQTQIAEARLLTDGKSLEEAIKLVPRRY